MLATASDVDNDKEDVGKDAHLVTHIYMHIYIYIFGPIQFIPIHIYIYMTTWIIDISRHRAAAGDEEGM